MGVVSNIVQSMSMEPEPEPKENLRKICHKFPVKENIYYRTF